MAQGIYDKYFITEPVEPGKFAPRLFFNSRKYFGEKNFSLRWNYITQPYLMEEKPHSHDFDQFLHFYGADPSNVREFGAEVELYLGEEGEKHVITATTIVHIPKGMIHCPLNFKKVDKPIIFMNVPLTPEYVRPASR